MPHLIQQYDNKNQPIIVPGKTILSLTYFNLVRLKKGEEYRAQALRRMEAAGATLTNHESVAFEWARHKDHPAFKAMSAIFKEGQPE